MAHVIVALLTAAGLVVVPSDGFREGVGSAVTSPCGSYTNDMNEPAAETMLDARAMVAVRRCSGGFFRIDRWYADTPAALVGTAGTAVVTITDLELARTIRSERARRMYAEFAIMVGVEDQLDLDGRVVLSETLCSYGTCVSDTGERFRRRIHFEEFPRQVPVRLWTSAGGGGSGSLDLHLTGDIRIRFVPSLTPA